RLSQPSIEVRRRHAPVPGLIDLHHGAEEPVESTLRQGGYGHKGDARDLRQLFGRRFPQLAQQRLLFRDEVPFVDGDYERAAFLGDEATEGEVLVLERRLCIDQQDDNLCETDRAERIGGRELLRSFGHLRLAPQPRRVDQAQLPPAPCEIDRDGVTRETGLWAGQQTLLAEQGIDQCRLA